MGRIAAPFGVRGWVRVTPWSEDPAALLEHRTWWLRASDDVERRSVEVVEAKLNARGILARFATSTTRDAAAAFLGCEISVPRSALRGLGKNEIYWADLVDLDVVNRQGVALGRVAEVAGNGAHPVLRVVQAGGTERLIPFVAAYVDRVDTVSRRIEVDWQPDY